MKNKQSLTTVLTVTLSALLVIGTVQAVTTLSSNIATDGNLAINTNKFTVAGATGNTSIAGTLGVTGNTTLTGDLAINGGDLTTLATTFNFDLPASGGTFYFRDGTNNLMTIADGGSVGNVNVTGTLNSAGDFSVATNKLTVAAATGNTVVAGTLGVTGETTLSSDLNLSNNLITNIGNADTDFVSGGGLNLKGALNLDGRQDEVQLNVQGYSTQTNEILLIEQNDGTDLLKIINDGTMYVDKIIGL